MYTIKEVSGTNLMVISNKKGRLFERDYSRKCGNFARENAFLAIARTEFED